MPLELLIENIVLMLKQHLEGCDHGFLELLHLSFQVLHVVIYHVDAHEGYRLLDADEKVSDSVLNSLSKSLVNDIIVIEQFKVLLVNELLPCFMVSFV